MHWVIVGPSGRHTRPESGGVLRHYHACEGKARHMVKTIVNTFYVANVASHPHNFEFRCDTSPPLKLRLQSPFFTRRLHQPNRPTLLDTWTVHACATAVCGCCHMQATARRGVNGLNCLIRPGPCCCTMWPFIIHLVTA